MNDTADRGLRRLQDPDDPACTELAAILVAQTTSTPLRELASSSFVAAKLAAALEAASQGPTLGTWFEARIADGRERWATDEAPAGDLVPDDAVEPLRSLLGRAYVPDEQLVYRLIDQPAIRSLVHRVLADTVTGFRRRLASVEARLGGGRDGAESRGFLGHVGRNLGGMAHSLVGAVKDEVDHALESRMTDFVEGATRESLRSIAAYLADPAHADGFAQMRLGFLDVLMDTPRAHLAAEAEKLEPEGAVHIVVAAVRASVGRPDFVEELAQRVQSVFDEVGDGSFGAWLRDIGLADVWDETATEIVAARLTALVTTDGFTDWWRRLHTP